MKRGFAVIALLGAAGLFQFSCDTPSGPMPEYPASPSHRWMVFRPEEYSVVEYMGCFCFPDTPALITVRGSTIIAAENSVTGAPLPRQRWGTYHPVEDFFSIIEAAERDTNAIVTAEYDTVYGYPTSFGVDRSLWIADDEYFYRLTHFTPLPRLPWIEPAWPPVQTGGNETMFRRQMP